MRAGTASLKKALRRVRPRWPILGPVQARLKLLSGRRAACWFSGPVISYIRLRRSHTSHCSTKSTITCGLHNHKRCLMYQLPKSGSRLVSRSAGQWLGRRARDLPSAFLGCPMNMQGREKHRCSVCVVYTNTGRSRARRLRCRSTSSRDTSDSADVEEPTGSQDTT